MAILAAILNINNDGMTHLSELLKGMFVQQELVKKQLCMPIPSQKLLGWTHVWGKIKISQNYCKMGKYIDGCYVCFHGNIHIIIYVNNI